MARHRGEETSDAARFQRAAAVSLLYEDGSSGVVEVFAAGKSRTYMYPKSWAYDNLESREFEALIGTFSREYLGREVKLAERKFLAAEEIQGLNAWLREIEYPLPTCDLLEKLPIRLLERGLRSEGLQGQNGQWWAEWPLTNRTNPKGYYVPLGYVRKTAISDVRAEGITVRAEIFFKNPVYGETKVLQPEDTPVIP